MVSLGANSEKLRPMAGVGIRSAYLSPVPRNRLSMAFIWREEDEWSSGDRQPPSVHRVWGTYSQVSRGGAPWDSPFVLPR